MILYHYCSNEAFHSIIDTRKIYLSCLSLSSDSMEGKLVSDLMLEMASIDFHDDEKAVLGLSRSISFVEKMFSGLGFCLSEAKDLLSQWRGYAGDATGVSMGFSKDYLEKLSDVLKSRDQVSFTLQQVIYKREDQLKHLKPTYEKIKEFINQGALRNPGRTILDARSDEERELNNKKTMELFKNLHWTVLELFGYLYILKNKAFQEEQEWRLVSYLIPQLASDTCLFRPSKSKIVSYRSFELENLGVEPIKEIVLGPKNTTPEDLIKKFLKQNNFSNVLVTRSEASYR